MTTSFPSSAEMQNLLKKIEETKPVPKTIRCEGKNGAVSYAKNPEYPPHRKGECEADDYGDWIYGEMPKILSYIHILEKEHRAMEVALNNLDKMTDVCWCGEEGDEGSWCCICKCKKVLSSLAIEK